jgi:hypothetical protein
LIYFFPNQACQARISTPLAQLCFRELQLGLIPGFGGSMAYPEKKSSITCKFTSGLKIVIMNYLL